MITPNENLFAWQRLYLKVQDARTRLRQAIVNLAPDAELQQLQERVTLLEQELALVSAQGGPLSRPAVPASSSASSK